MINIEFVAADFDFDKVSINLNDRVCDFQVVDNVIVINSPLQDGLHQLKLLNQQCQKIEIIKVYVNGVDLRETLFYSWLEQQGEKFQPATALWQADQTWVLPFASPASLWVTLTATKFPSGSAGTDIWSEFTQWYPNKIELPQHYPAELQDFFHRDFDFTVARTDDRAAWPFARIHVPDHAVQALSQQVMKFYSENKWQDRVQVGYSNKHQADWWWWRIMRWDDEIGQCVVQIDQKEFPQVYEVIEYLQIKDLHSVDVAFLEPGAWIAPHRDRVKKGKKEFYIPLHAKPGNYIKLAGVGCWDISNTPCMINIVDHVHSVVNTSNQIRAVLLIRCDADANQHLWSSQ